MADRRRDVLLLLRSRYDGLYLPPGALRTSSGFVPAAVEPCRECGGVLLLDDFGKVIRRRRGRGWVLDRFKRRQPCTGCGGRWDGDTLVRGGGEVARDPMDSAGARVGSSGTASTARPRRMVVCDACGGDGVRAGARCVRCDGVGRRELHAFDLAIDTRDVDERDPMLSAIEERNRSGSYAELERALAGIRVHVNKPARYRWLTDNAAVALRLVDEVTVGDRPEVDLDAGERALFDLAVAYVVDRMPARIRVPAEVRANARELAEHRRRLRGRRLSGEAGAAVARRDAEIRAELRRGRPVQWVAQEYGLSVSRVYQIKRGEAA